MTSGGLLKDYQKGLKKSMKGQSKVYEGTIMRMTIERLSMRDYSLEI